MEKSVYRKSVGGEPDIVFSKMVSAGKRIYYIDVKKNRKNELFITITESKKILSEDPFQPAVHFEKHKVFLYKEDFDKFIDALNETLIYAKENYNSHLFSSKDEGDINDLTNLNPFSL